MLSMLSQRSLHCSVNPGVPKLTAKLAPFVEKVDEGMSCLRKVADRPGSDRCSQYDI